MLGIDPARPTREWRERVGIVLQQCRMRPELTVRDTLELYAGYYREARPVGETIERVGLGEKADERTGGSPAASSAGSTSLSRLSATPTCSSSTSRRPGSTPPLDARPGA